MKRQKLELKNKLAIALLITFIAAFGQLQCDKKDQPKVNIKVVKIGVIAPLTGDVASYGEKVKNGILLAADKIGGPSAKVKFNFIFEDSQCKPANAVSAYKKLVSVDKVNMVLGPICSGATLAVGPLAQKDGMVLFTPVSSADNISNIGEFVFRLAPYDSLQGEIIAKWMLGKGYKKMAVLYINNNYGVGLMNAFNRIFQKNGGQVLASESFDEGNVDFRAQWQKIKSEKPEAVFAPAYPAEALNLLKQRFELGIKIPTYGTDPYHDPMVLNGAKNAANGIEFTDVAKPESDEWNNFFNSYKVKYNSEPNIVAAQAYDSAMVAMQIITNMGGQSIAIQKGFTQLKGYKGATGLVEFNQNGDCVTTTFNKFVIQDGQYKPLGE